MSETAQQPSGSTTEATSGAARRSTDDGAPLTEEDVVALERQGWEALSGPDGAAYYEQHLADEALMAFPFGVLDRAASLQAVASTPPWSSYRMADPRVLHLGEDVAVVVYRAEGRREGQPGYAAVVSSTFVRRDGEWRLVFHQQSPAPSPG